MSTEYSYSANGSLESSFSRIAEEISSKYISDGIILGLGSGSTVARFAAVLGERVKEGLRISIVPSSIQALLLAQKYHLSESYDLGHCPPSVDVAVDGADQVGTRQRCSIKGGGGALLREKVILSSACRAFIIADESKFVPLLSRSVPIEVIQFALFNVRDKILQQYGGAEVRLRTLEKGYPFFTESGNIILDCDFKGDIDDPQKAETALRKLPGVVEVGIFNCEVDDFYKAKNDGSYDRI